MVFVGVRRVSDSGRMSAVLLDEQDQPTGEVLNFHRRQGRFIGHNGSKVCFKGDTRQLRGNRTATVPLPRINQILIAEVAIDLLTGEKQVLRWGCAKKWRTAIRRLRKNRRRNLTSKFQPVVKARPDHRIKQVVVR
ncbi:MAG TPA: hypothetical protein VFN31_01260 [Candidatus Saccharimonadales bacterium]|nr:hypothetical protein [Candidatus Saccharimonadales bacterium]